MRAVLDTGRALELEAGEPDEARALALEAHKLAPDLVPAATLAARLFVRAGEIRRASRVLEATWKITPHPEIAEAYAAVRPGDSALDRLKRVRHLAALKANHPEGALAIARAAIDARDWQAARTALGGAMRANPTERVCRLMAEIEEGEHGDDGRVRAWLTRALMAPRDPAWVADGQVFAGWAPISPISGRIDAFEWRVPSDRPPGGSVEIEALEPIEPAEQAREALAPEEPPVRPKPTIVAEASRDAPKPVSAAPAIPTAAAKGVRPMARAPDDPGPETDFDGDQVPLDPFRPGRTA